MSEPYIGEIRMFAGNYAPVGWEFCHGQLLPIAEYDTLFMLIGITYGGDGQTTFGLPDLRGRIPVHMGQNPQTGTIFTPGQKAGTETVTLTLAQLPNHTHTVTASTIANTNSPANAVWASGAMQFANTAPNGTMNPVTVSSVGGNNDHENRMPYLPINFIISLYGIYPSQA